MILKHLHLLFYDFSMIYYDFPKFQPIKCNKGKKRETHLHQEPCRSHKSSKPTNVNHLSLGVLHQEPNKEFLSTFIPIFFFHGAEDDNGVDSCRHRPLSTTGGGTRPRWGPCAPMEGRSLDGGSLTWPGHEQRQLHDVGSGDGG